MYPQVEPGVRGLLNVAVAAVAAGASVDRALRLARAQDAAAVAVGEGWALREDLARGAALGLEEVPAALLTRPLPVVEATAGEVTVRRRLAAGAPLVIVRERRAVLGGISVPSLQGRVLPGLGRLVTSQLGLASHALLATIRHVVVAQGARAFLTGGSVRDAFRRQRGQRGAPKDLDLVVEGDGLRVARGLAEALGTGPREITEHSRFLTASVTVPGGGRVDIATARSERYEVRGALPRVLPATIGQDLARRDFTVNALAVDLGSGEFDLLDPFGGRHDLVRRRLRVLHPLSFVEDPTRIFRAARYATRLGFAPDGWTARALGLALRLVPYPALSGQRLAVELALILADTRPDQTLARLGAAGSLRLLDERYRFGRPTRARLGPLVAALDWAGRHGLQVAPVELAALTLVADQPDAVANAALVRLGFSGEPLARLRRALAAEPSAPAKTLRPSQRARRLAGRSDVELAWLWLAGGTAMRRALDWFAGPGRAVRPALRGEDVMALGVPAGRPVAAVLAALRDARLDGAVADRDAEAAYVRDWIDRARTEG